MRPNLTFQTGRDLAVKPKDVISNRTYNVQRSSSRENTRYIQPDNSDDALVGNESGYDLFIKEKGVTSSSPVVLGIIPIREPDQEEEIINIQRNLNIQTMNPVSKIINETTGSFTNQERQTVEQTPTRELSQAFNDLFSTYLPKANYLNFIDDFLDLQVSDAPKFDVDVRQISSGGSIIFNGPTPSGISTYSSTREWASNRIAMRAYADRFNITNMMQMLKNSLSRLRYTTLGGIAPAAEPAFAVDGISLDPVYADAGTTLINLYNSSQIILEGDFDSISDQMLLIVTKEEIFNRSFASGANIRESITSLTGDLVNDLRAQDFQSRPGLGVFDLLVYQENEGKTVLSFDNILTNQEFLNDFETSDQFYLVYPISNDKQLLVSRANRYEQIINEIVPSITSFNEKLTRDNEVKVIKSYFNTLNDFLQRSILVTGSIEDQEQYDSAKTLTVLLKAREDKRLLDYIIKILMFRDRIRNPNDYVNSDQRNSFIEESNKKLQEYVRLLTINYFGYTYEDPERPGPYTNQTDGFQRIADLLNGASIGRDADSRALSRQWAQEENGSANESYIMRNAFSHLQDELLDTSRSSLWDVFFEGAKTVENSPARSTGAFDGNPLNLRAGQQTQFYQIARDHRALSFLMSTLRFLSTGVSATRYYMQASTVFSGESTGYRYDFGHQPGYFNDLVTSIRLIADNSFRLATRPLGGVSFLSQENFVEIRAPLTDFSNYASTILITLLQSLQDAVDALNYLKTYMTTSLSLLKQATTAAFNYNTKYGESLATLYTANTLTNLAKLKNSKFSSLQGFKKFDAYYFRSSAYLPGMVQYAQKVLPKSEDSFVVICGLPYGLLERLGAYSLDRERDVSITLTFRAINDDSPVVYAVTKRYPASSFIDPGKQEYSIESYASQDLFLESTRLYYMNQSGALAVDKFSDSSIKMNELESTSILEYLRILYGLNLDLEVLTQNSQVDASALFPGLESAKNKVLNKIEMLRYDDLITSRYMRTAENAIMFGQQENFQRSLAGYSFDKIVAIPIEGSLLRKDKDFYLCDMLITVNLTTAEQIQQTTAAEISRTVSSRSSRVSSTARSIVRNSFGRSS